MLEGLLAALSPGNILLALVGVVSGTVVGALPGLTATMAVAILVPVTFSMSPASALILMGAIYTGAIYGGAYAAILLNTPGTPSAIATTFDGYPMAKRGDGDLAVTLGCLSSVTGGLVGALALLLLSPPLAEFALAFRSVEYFWLAILGLSLVSALSASDFLKGVIGACFGMLLAVIGVAEVSADVRLVFGSRTLLGGIEVVSALIGLYCVPVLMDLASSPARHLEKPPDSGGYRLAEAARLCVKGKWNLIRSSVIGTAVGVLPGAGGSIAGLVAYTEARRRSKNPDNFGKGEPAGVQASESSNNATVGGGLIPTLVLGIPGTPPDAVILGALLVQGVRTGPDLFNEGAVVYTFVWGLLLATLLMLPAGLLIGRRAYRFVAETPRALLVPVIGFLTVIGSYSIRNSISDVVIMIILGVLGWLLTRFGFSVSPVVLGLILSSIAEQGFVQAWTIGSATNNLAGVFFGRPLSMAIIALVVLAFAAGLRQKGPGRFSAARPSSPKNGDKTPGQRRTGDIVAAALFVAAAGVVWADAADYADADSSVFPKTISAVMVFFSALLAWRGLAGRGRAPASAASGSGFRRAAVVASMLAASALMPFVGFYLSALAMMLALVLTANFEKWTPPRAGGFALCILGVSAGFFLLFSQGFQVPLPAGKLWE